MRRRLGCWYEPGDMVWAKFILFPWWPGRILDEAEVATEPAVSETKIEGHVLVSFFGDNSFRWLNPREIVPFDSNYVEFTKKKEQKTEAFRKAVEKAEVEIRQRAALGLSCCCGNSSNFRETDVPGFLAVDVQGHPRVEKYSVRQIENARDGFRPIRVLCFVQVMATRPLSDEQCGVEWMKNVAIALAYRKAVFQDSDETWNQALEGETPQTEEEEAPFSGPSMHEKEPALAPLDLDHIITPRALAVGGSMTPDVASLQSKNSVSDAPLVPGHTASGAALFVNSKPELEKISAAYRDDADNMDFIDKNLSLPNVSGRKILAVTEGTEKEPGLLHCFLQSEKDLSVEKWKTREETELQTCQEKENGHKHRRSTKEGAYQSSKDEKSNETQAEEESATLPASPSASPEPVLLPLFIKEAKNSNSDVWSLSPPSMQVKEAAVEERDDIIDARPQPCSHTPESTCPQNENRNVLAITEGVEKKLESLQCIIPSEKFLVFKRRKNREEMKLETCQLGLSKCILPPSEKVLVFKRRKNRETCQGDRGGRSITGK